MGPTYPGIFVFCVWRWELGVLSIGMAALAWLGPRRWHVLNELVARVR